MSALSTITFPTCAVFPVEAVDEIPMVEGPVESGSLIASRRNERRLRSWRLRFGPASHALANHVRRVLVDAKGGALAVLLTPPTGEDPLDVRVLAQSTRIEFRSHGEAHFEVQVEEVR